VAAGTMAALPFVSARLRTAVLLFPLIGIAPTFSRSGLLCAAITIVLAMAFRLVNRMQIVVLLFAVSALAAATSVYYDDILSASDETNAERVMQRLTWFQDMQGDKSVDDRVYPAVRAWEMFLDTPITGKGTGVTSRPALGDGTHNIYLMLMAEHGVFGLVLSLSLVGAIALRGWKIAREAATDLERDVGRTMLVYAGFLAVYGCFSHNVLEEPHGIFLMAFLVAAGSVAGANRRNADSMGYFDAHTSPTVRLRHRGNA